MSYQVIITHFVNPHRFFFSKINTPEYVNVKVEIEGIEKKLKRLVSFKPTPTKGMLVSVFYAPWRRLIRARVAEILLNGTICILWVVDYGFPLMTAMDYIFNIPNCCQTLFDHIKIGGIAYLMPVENINKQHYDKTKFDEEATMVAKRIFKEAITINFVSAFKSNGQYWGDLRIDSLECREISLFVELRDKRFGAYCMSFRLHLETLETVKIPAWRNNDGFFSCEPNRTVLKHAYMYDSLIRPPKMSTTLTPEKMEQMLNWECFTCKNDELMKNEWEVIEEDEEEEEEKQEEAKQEEEKENNDLMTVNPPQTTNKDFNLVVLGPDLEAVRNQSEVTDEPLVTAPVWDSTKKRKLNGPNSTN